jgi:hypothetical protein
MRHAPGGILALLCHSTLSGEQGGDQRRRPPAPSACPPNSLHPSSPLWTACRKVPHKGKLLAGSAVFGSTFLAAMRWLFGVWLPSLHQASPFCLTPCTCRPASFHSECTLRIVLSHPASQPYL